MTAIKLFADWEFNALGGLNFSEGYQIKMLEEVSDFQFVKQSHCKQIKKVVLIQQR